MGLGQDEKLFIAFDDIRGNFFQCTLSLCGHDLGFDSFIFDSRRRR